MRPHLWLLFWSLIGMAVILILEHSLYAKIGGALLATSATIMLLCSRIERYLHRAEQVSVVVAVLLISGAIICTLRAGHL